MNKADSAPYNPHGYFSSKISDRSQRKNSLELLKTLDKFQRTPNNDGDAQKTLCNDIYTALESGVSLPMNLQELALLEAEQELDRAQSILSTLNGRLPHGHFFEMFINGSNRRINATNDFLKKYQDESGDYDTKSEWVDTPNFHGIGGRTGPQLFNQFKENVRGVFRENPQRLFEKAADYPETVRRLVDVLDLPAQNVKGWNLTSQAAKAGNPKLANAFESAGFGPNLHTKIVVDFAKAMTDGSNAQKSPALKELMGITSLS